MGKPWDEIADAYFEELKTRADDVHFGVGIPGNRELGVIQLLPGGVALELGCGSGENLVALSQMGYQTIGIDSSTRQLALASDLLALHHVDGRLVCADICAASELNFGVGADVVLSVGVAHFCSSFETFVSNCARLLKPGGSLVISLPHPLDMLADATDTSVGRLITFNNYYPDEGKITTAHYWRRFAGRICLADSLVEYVRRPSEIINVMISFGFEIRGMWEPKYRGIEEPCLFRNPDEWFNEHFYPNVPQYLIVKGALRTKG